MADPAQPGQPSGQGLAKPVSAMGLSPVPPQKPKAGAAQKGAGWAVALILGGIYAAEGGYVNHDADPGGATNFGVTEQVARAHGYAGDMRNFPKHCEGSATVCADEVYLRDYIERPGYMPLITIAPAVADKLVNTATNTGPPRPNRWFRETLGLPPSSLPLGRTDLFTYQMQEARLGVTAACEATLRSLAAKQEGEYLRLIRGRPSFAVFRNGWIKRARNLHPSGIPCEPRP